MLEVWKDILGHEGRYQASSFGNIKSLANAYKIERILKPAPTSRGYLSVQLYLDVRPKKSKSFLVHRLVAQTFYDNPESHRYVCHIDGDKLNNKAENLYWGTAEMNAADKTLHGTQLFGEKNHKAKVTEADVLEIRRLSKKGIKNAVLARQYGLSPTTVSHINSRQIWKHI